MTCGAVRSAADQRCFFVHAAAMTGIVIPGFGLNAVLGRVDYRALPWTVHLHGLLYIGWYAIAVAQPWLVGRGRWRLQRRIGWAACVLALVMVVGAMLLTVVAVLAGRMRPGKLFLVLNGLTVVPLLMPVGTAIGMRDATGWHRRLLASATVLLTGPGASCRGRQSGRLGWPRLR